ncbi:MAG: glycoside hydrolase family 3 protein [Pyrinomonadaceae bacterium]
MNAQFSKTKSLSLEQRIGQLFFIGISGPVIDGETHRLLSEIKPGGVCLFARNIKEPAQTRDLLENVTKDLEIQPFLSIDQEGGLVDRLRRILTPMPAVNKLRNTDNARELASIIAESLRILGFNVNFAPVVDVIDQNREQANNGMYSRAFGKGTSDVIEMAGAFLDEMQAGGIIGCLKHFPGLGAAEADSHEELPTVSIDDKELRETDLCAYREIDSQSEVGMIMIAHAAYPNTDLQERDQNGRLLPSSLSYNFVTKLLRNEMVFDGVAITDDLEMGAITKAYGIGEACKMAVKAGNDMLAICAGENSIREGFSAIFSAVESGEIAESRIDESIQRIADLKSKIAVPIEFDPAKLDALSERVKQLNARLN